MNLPKVLIINQPFNNNTGGGITLSNLFIGWDKSKIAVVCPFYLLENVDTNICNTYYQLGYEENEFVFPFSLLKRKHYSGVLKFDEKKTLKSTMTANPGLRSKLIMNYFYPVLRYLGLYNNTIKTKLSHNLCSWLDDFNPDVIYAVATTSEAIKFILLVQSYLKKPLVFHMMDDWITSPKGLFKNLELKKNDREFRKLLNKADVLMSISDGMADEYKARYGKSSATFHNPIDIEFWNKYQRSNYDLKDSPTILYAGRIGLGIDSSLEIVAKAIQQVNQNLKLSVKFVLQTKEKPQWSSKYECVEHNSFVPYADLPRVFAEADFLILPYDFSPQSIQYIGLSMPTKATEYMISGTPIIVFSPEGTAIVKYANKYGWAKVITENNVDRLYEGIAYLIENKTARQQIAQKAIKVAEDRHSLAKITSHFREVIGSLIDNPAKPN